MYEVPKISVPVSLHLINEETIPGKLFVSEDQFSPEGNPLTTWAWLVLLMHV